MRVDLREDYPGELAGRSEEELAVAIVAELRIVKSQTAPAYRSPADFQARALWDLHERMTALGRQRLERLRAAVDGRVAAEVGA